MRRVLVVGCGGSGGQTLAYMMDQLRADLGAYGIEKIPDVWQFVHIDVPVEEESMGGQIRNVVSQGGHYVSTGSKERYAIVDGAVSQRLAAAGKIADIGTWAPDRPEDVTVPISDGAGQYRAIGRMVTLNRAQQIVETFNAARDRMYTSDATSEANRMCGAYGGQSDFPDVGTFKDDLNPLVLVVSSMAGGAGASMALDVCRLLSVVDSIDPRLIAVFLCTAEVFEKSLAPHERQGVNGNSLAMLGEVMALQASQTGQAANCDVDILRGLGIPAVADQLFARVFPIGRKIGGDGAEFGDGSASGVYRGLGRGLSALVKSDKAQDPFVQYDLTNTGSPAGDPSIQGWGTAWDPLPWSSFGFATLSMGRDRYAEYSAQRIGRFAIDRLVAGHLFEGTSAGGPEQLARLVTDRFDLFCDQVGLPKGAGVAASTTAAGAIDPSVFQWLTTVAMGPQQGRDVGQRIVAPVVQELQSAGSLDTLAPDAWRTTVQSNLALRRGAMQSDADQQAYRWAFEWSERLLAALENIMAGCIATYGLPYAIGLGERLTGANGQGGYLDAVALALDAIARGKPTDIAAMPDDVSQTLSQVKGKLINSAEIVTQLRTRLQGVAEGSFHAEAASQAAKVLRAFSSDAVASLVASMREMAKHLEDVRMLPPQHDGVARVGTDDYPSWPAESDEKVPARFAQAQNEVLITDTAEFDARFRADLPLAMSSEATIAYPDALSRAGYCVIAGEWPTSGGAEAPRGLVERLNDWVPGHFREDPRNPGRSLVRSAASFRIHAYPADIRARAQGFVNRPDTSFARFIGESLRSYLMSPTLEEERDRRQRDMTAKFQLTRDLARPLAAVNSTRVAELHASAGEARYAYKFSAIPFTDLGIVPALRKLIESDSKCETMTTLTRFDSALSDEDGARRIDVFGSYQNYSPLVFTSVLGPISDEWTRIAASDRLGFWKWRRTRPLLACLPMGDLERRTMIAGWYLGQILGLVDLPARDVVDVPARVWDSGQSRMIDFPFPMLTPPDRFRSPQDEWLPAVLESSLLAYCSVAKMGLASVRPYQALREIFDDSRDGKTTTTKSGQRNLAAWLATGTTVSGRAPRSPECAQAATPDERLEAFKNWCHYVEERVANRYLKNGEYGSKGTGAFSDVRDREIASKMPIMADIAEDCCAALSQLRGMADQAALMNAATGASSDYDDGGVY